MAVALVVFGAGTWIGIEIARAEYPHSMIPFWPVWIGLVALILGFYLFAAIVWHWPLPGAKPDVPEESSSGPSPWVLSSWKQGGLSEWLTSDQKPQCEHARLPATRHARSGHQRQRVCSAKWRAGCRAATSVCALMGRLNRSW